MTKEETKAYMKAYNKRKSRIEKGLRGILKMYIADDLENTEQFDENGREYKEYVWSDRPCVRVEYLAEMLERMTAFIHSIDCKAEGKDPFVFDDNIFKGARSMAMRWVFDKALVWTGDYEPDKNDSGCLHPVERDYLEYCNIDESAVFKRGVIRLLNAARLYAKTRKEM